MASEPRLRSFAPATIVRCKNGKTFCRSKADFPAVKLLPGFVFRLQNSENTDLQATTCSLQRHIFAAASLESRQRPSVKVYCLVCVDCLQAENGSGRRVQVDSTETDGSGRWIQVDSTETDQGEGKVRMERNVGLVSGTTLIVGTIIGKEKNVGLVSGIELIVRFIMGEERTIGLAFETELTVSIVIGEERNAGLVCGTSLG